MQRARSLPRSPPYCGHMQQFSLMAAVIATRFPHKATELLRLPGHNCKGRVELRGWTVGVKPLPERNSTDR